MPGPIVVNGTSASDTLVVTALTPDSGFYSLNGGGLVGFSGVTSFTFNGLDGGDIFTVQNPSGDLFAPSGGIFYNSGGSAFDTFNDFGGAASSGSYATAFGIIQHTAGALTQVVTLSNLGSISDTVSDGAFTVVGTGGPDTFSLIDGGTADGAQTTRIGSSTVPISVANKLVLNINGNGGADTLDFNNPN